MSFYFISSTYFYTITISIINTWLTLKSTKNNIPPAHFQLSPYPLAQ